MSAVPKPQKLTVAEYLAIEERSEVRHEFYDGEMFAMAGASRHHVIIVSNLVTELNVRLRGTPCRADVIDLRVKVETTGLFTYPDVVIVCGPRQWATDDPNAIVNPQVVIEVLSPSTANYDRTTKFQHYQRLPSVQEYVLVSQDRVWVERLVRQPDDTWNLSTFTDPAGELVLASVPVRVPLADVYRDVELPEPPALR